MARLIAVDLGHDAVKAVVYEGTGPEDGVEASLRERIPQDGTELPTLDDRLAALDRLVRKHADRMAGAHHTVLAWPSAEVSTHRLQLPFTDEAQIGQTLPFAIEAEVPFDLDDMVLAWRPGLAEGEVVATLARAAPIARAIAKLSELGLNPRRVVADGDVLGAYATGDDVVAVIDVGHGGTTVAVARAGQTLAQRSLGVGGRAFVRAVQHALGATWSDARRLLVGEGAVESTDDGPDLGSLTAEAAADPAFDDDDDGPVDAGSEPDTAPVSFEPPTTPTADAPAEAEVTDPGGRDASLPAKALAALDQPLGLLLAEVRTTLVVAEDELELGIDRIVLTGGAADVPRLVAYLEQDLGLPVTAPRLDGTTPGGPFAVATALGRADTGTDLRVGDLAYKHGTDRAVSVLQYGGLGLGFYLVAILCLFAYYAYDYAGQRAEVEGRIQSTVGAVVPDAPEGIDSTSAVVLLSDMVYDAEQALSFIGEPGDAPPTVDLLYRITQGFPPHPDGTNDGVAVDIDTLEVTPANVRLEGTVDDFPAVDQVAESLTAAGFENVEAEPGTKKGDKLEFSVDFPREGEEEAGDTDDDAYYDEEG